MVNRKTRSYIIALEAKLRWAGQYISVSDYTRLDWSSTNLETLTHIKTLMLELEDAQHKLAQLAKQLQLKGDVHQVSRINKVIKTLAKYVGKNDGIQI